MFCQVHVFPSDRGALRFLWWIAGNLDVEALNCKMTIHLFGAKNLLSCGTFCLRKTARQCGKHSNPDVKTVRKSFYVGDLSHWN